MARAVIDDFTDWMEACKGAAADPGDGDVELPGLLPGVRLAPVPELAAAARGAMTMSWFQLTEPRLADASDASILALWSRCVSEMLSGPKSDPATVAVVHALVSAYCGDVCTAHRLEREFFKQRLSWEEPELWLDARRRFERCVLSRLNVLSAFAVIAPVEDAHDSITLTPLGVYVVRCAVLERGGVAPEIPDVVGPSARVAATQIVIAGPQLSRQIALEWLDGKDRRSALDDLLQVAAGFNAVPRYQLLCELVTIEGVPDVLLALACDHPLLRPVVRAAVAEQEVIARWLDVVIDAMEHDEPLVGEAAEELAVAREGLSWRSLELSREDRDLLVVDTLARVVFAHQSAIRPQDLSEDCWELADEPTVLRMAGSPHREVTVVLEAIASGHAAGRLRKAAKRALHKRTRQSGRVPT